MKEFLNNVRFMTDSSEISFYILEILISGALMFIAGMFINIHSDHILRNLRKPGETGYKIPQGK